MKITIGHLFPDLLNLYGDRGNIAALTRRMQARGIETEVKSYGIDDDINFADLDIVFIGGGSDREQLLVCKKLLTIKSDITQYVENGGTLAAVCGGYQLLGHYYQLENEKIEGLKILDIYTVQGSPRLIGNIVLDSDYIGTTVVGFENHGGRTFINSHKPLGKVLYGHGNDGESGYEGVVYKNVVATYLHGPLLPKNPVLADKIIENAVTKKDASFVLSDIDSALENTAHDYIIKRFLKK